jgi:hypothetical protein
MLPVSVEPRAKMKMTSRQGPRVSSFEVEPTSWRSARERSVTGISTGDVSTGIATGLARATEARAKTAEKRMLMVTFDWQKKKKKGEAS